MVFLCAKITYANNGRVQAIVFGRSAMQRERAQSMASKWSNENIIFLISLFWMVELVDDDDDGNQQRGQQRKKRTGTTRKLD